MRILQIIAQKPGQTGSGVFLNNLIRIGAEKHHQQCVVAGISALETASSQELPADVVFYPVLFETDALPFPVPGMSDAMPYPSTQYRMMSGEMVSQWKTAFQAALAQAAAWRPDLIIVHHLWLLAAMTREYFPDQPMVAICHGTELRQLVLAGQFHQEVVSGCRKIDRVAALNLFQKEAIAADYGIAPEKIIVTGSGFNQAVFYPPEKPWDKKTINILYAGKLSRAKGVPSLIRAYSRLAGEGERLKLILVGAGCGEELAEIEALVAASPLRIELTGALPQCRLAELMRQSQIFVLPSFYEGLSLVTLEALASGMRIVTNDLPGMREWVGTSLAESGVVEYVTMPGLSEADLPLIEELPAYEQRLSRGICRQAAAMDADPERPLAGWQEMSEKYSWPVLLARIEKIYDQLSLDKKE